MIFEVRRKKALRERKPEAGLWLDKKTGARFHGYPVATVAFYGPSDKLATKVAVSISDPFYVPPAVRICHGINAPAVLFRFPIMFLWDKAQLTRRAAEDITDESVFLLGVALLWFFIGRKIDLWRSRHSDIGHLQPRPRLIVDALGISGGLLLGLLGAGKLLAPTHERIPEALLFFGWCLLLTSFFGYQVFADLTSLKTKGA